MLRFFSFIIILLISTVSWAQSYANGTVFIKGETVYGASAVVVATQFGAFTEDNGNFRVERPRSEAFTITIRFSRYKANIEISDPEIFLDHKLVVNFLKKRKFTYEFLPFED